MTYELMTHITYDLYFTLLYFTLLLLLWLNYEVWIMIYDCDDSKKCYDIINLTMNGWMTIIILTMW